MRFKLIVHLNPEGSLGSDDVAKILDQVADELREYEFGAGSGRIVYDDSPVGMWEVEDVADD